MDSILLYALPKTEPWTLERFLDEIKKACKEAASDLHRRSVMIEDAVEDLIGLSLQVRANTWIVGTGGRGIHQSPLVVSGP